MKAVKLGFVAVALVATLALAGCDQDPAQALRVGNVTFSNSQVDETAQEFVNALAASGSAVSDPVATVRSSVVQQMIFKEVARRYAAEKGISIPAPDYEATASSLGVDVNDPYARLTAEVSPFLDTLRSQVPPRTPTEAEMRQVFTDFVAIAGPDAATYEEIRSELLGLPEYAQSLGLRDELLKAMDRYGVTISPRYQPVSFPLLVVANGQLDLVSLPLGQQGTGAVRDA
jgi:hypothetical protein